MDYLSLIKKPIEKELLGFIDMFNGSLEHDDGLLQQALNHIRQRAGKRMRPMLILLMAKNFGEITDVTLHAAGGLELLHTVSLVHDDVVDESSERRGQASVNATYDNKVAVLVGDYLLSIALQQAAMTQSLKAVDIIARLGGTLSAGEVFQLDNIQQEAVTEEAYFHIIAHKTAALFAACGELGALTAGADEVEVQRARELGQLIGMCFQIRDDIFDYYDQSRIGKPTGNDMAEGKLTLPAIYALNSTHNEEMLAIAYKVKNGSVSKEEIARLVAFTKEHGGIEYAERRMWEMHAEALTFIEREVEDVDLKSSLRAYLDFVIEREK